MKDDIKRLTKIWKLPYEQRRLILQDQRDEWGEDRFFKALWEFAKDYKP
jgi:hypothetical protein